MKVAAVVEKSAVCESAETGRLRSSLIDSVIVETRRAEEEVEGAARHDIAMSPGHQRRWLTWPYGQPVDVNHNDEFDFVLDSRQGRDLAVVVLLMAGNRAAEGRFELDMSISRD